MLLRPTEYHELVWEKPLQASGWALGPAASVMDDVADLGHNALIVTFGKWQKN